MLRDISGLCLADRQIEKGCGPLFGDSLRMRSTFWNAAERFVPRMSNLSGKAYLGRIRFRNTTSQSTESMVNL